MKFSIVSNEFRCTEFVIIINNMCDLKTILWYRIQKNDSIYQSGKIQYFRKFLNDHEKIITHQLFKSCLFAYL